MHTAAQVSIGGRKQVLENGADVCNSGSDSENEDHGETLKGAYTSDIPLDSNGNPISASHKLSQAQADALRAKAARPPRPLTPTPVVSVLPDPPKSSGKKKAPKVPVKSEHPMGTRSKSKTASGAGSLRPVGGSGSTDTCVATGRPSKT
jgi:hypothetical protein